MSWDAGATSNFGALTFPTDSAGGGATSPNLVVSSLTAVNYVSTATVISQDISAINFNSQNISTNNIISLNVSATDLNSQRISTNNLTVSSINSLPFFYSYGGNTQITTQSTITLPFSYADDGFSVIAQYNSLAGYAPAVTAPLVCITDSPSTFIIHNGIVGTFDCNYITVGKLN